MISKLGLTQRNLDGGVVQNYYKNGELEIIISDISAGAKLVQHSHEEKQFGFCFNNNFYFNIGATEHLIKEMSIYDLDGFVTHSAKNPFSEVSIALDIKFLDLDRNDYNSNGICEWKKYEFKDFRICKYENFWLDFAAVCLKSENKEIEIPFNFKYFIPYMGEYCLKDIQLENYGLYTTIGSEDLIKIQSDSKENKIIFFSINNK